MKKLILSAVVLALTSGAAMADRFHGGHAVGGGRQGGVVVHNNAGNHEGYRGGNAGWHEGRGNGGWHGNVGVRGGGYYNDGPRYYHTHGVVRSNIWVDRPVIREHYYHYGYRPGLIFENYGAREGYIFVRGNWAWDGGEWVWQQGHYEPDAAYVEVY